MLRNMSKKLNVEGADDVMKRRLQEAVHCLLHENHYTTVEEIEYLLDDVLAFLIKQDAGTFSASASAAVCFRLNDGLPVSAQGFPGSIFCLNAKNEIQTPSLKATMLVERIQNKVAGDLPFCHPGEKDVFIRICRLATAHLRLAEFIRQNGDIMTTSKIENSSSKGYGGGVYLRSLSNALDEVFVKPYLRHLVDLEREILGDRFLTVSHIQWSLEKYQSVLPALVRFTDEVASKQAHGCQILELIHSHVVSGLPNVAVVFKSIQRVCHAALVRNLTDWLLYGVLHDPFNEFFISQHCVTSDAIESDANVQSSDAKGLLKRKQTLKNSNLDSTVVFHLRSDMLPSYISADVAKTILFVGESIHMLEHSSLLLSSRITSGIDSTNILRHKRETFARDLHNWQQKEDMEIARFELIVNNIRSCVAEHLWTLVVEKANLTGHLESLKDFFLLGRGDLYTTFIEEADTLLSLPPTANTKHMVNHVFQLVGQNKLPEDDDYFGNFKLIVGTDDDRKGRHSEGGILSSSAATGWSHLRLEYSAPFPIHTVFTSESLNDLNELFQFLLKVKRLQLALHRCWALRMNARHRRLNEGDPKKWHLRTCMAFLVDNLQFYLQVDVLGNQYNMLIAKIKETRDFQQVQLAFHLFITNIRTQTFILMETLFKTLNEFLDLCSSFCYTLDRQQRSSSMASTGNYSPSRDSDDKLLRVFGPQFWRSANLLVKLLSGIRAHQAGPHVTQLLNTIDVNQYFSKRHQSNFTLET